MEIPFFKYHGTGNDFILIDNRKNIFKNCSQSLISKLCDRWMGIGADGLILLGDNTGYDFQMTYFNSDGNQGTMCGNGGRCLVAFARKLKIVEDKTCFLAIDGIHEAVVIDEIDTVTSVKLKMRNIDRVEENDNFYYLNTGSPHYVQYVENLENFNVFDNGKVIRNSERFKAEGTNVNFIEQLKDYLLVRTYERGVENETLSCGSGVTASALVSSIRNKTSTKENRINIRTLGGFLTIQFEKVSDQLFENIWLEGPATFVFQGKINLEAFK